MPREKLEHFEQVNQWLERRGIPLGPLSSPPYGAGLKAQIRRNEPERLLDSLLVSGLIEARSHERLGLLATHCPEAELAQFYQGLMASEARHYGTYWILADTYSERSQVTQRLQEIAEYRRDMSRLYNSFKQSQNCQAQPFQFQLWADRVTRR